MYQCTVPWLQNWGGEIWKPSAIHEGPHNRLIFLNSTGHQVETESIVTIMIEATPISRLHSDTVLAQASQHMPRRTSSCFPILGLSIATTSVKVIFLIPSSGDAHRNPYTADEKTVPVKNDTAMGPLGHRKKCIPAKDPHLLHAHGPKMSICSVSVSRRWHSQQ